MTFVKGRWHGQTLETVFMQEFVYKNFIYFFKSMAAGNIKVNGEVVNGDFRFAQNQMLTHLIHRHEPPVIDLAIEIIHQDEDLLVVNKPSSIPCHPTGHYRHNSVTHILKKELELAELWRKNLLSFLSVLTLSSSSLPSIGSIDFWCLDLEQNTPGR